MVPESPPRTSAAEVRLGRRHQRAQGRTARLGIPNVIEYAFGLDPQSNSAGQLPVAELIDGALEIRFVQPADVTGIVYGAEWSSTLQEGSWQDLPDAGSAGEHVFRLPVIDGDKCFIRLKVLAR